jgi:Tol biopolymer transport system component
MPFAPGTRWGVYEIVDLLGTGSMGEVYRARDTRLHRDVAIKVLRSPVAAGPDRLARFEREARLLASLNHPNIAQIHGFEDSGGVPALVMELVPGVTLAERLAQGALSRDEAFVIARQVSDALEAAHEQGVVHRDLKPANIKITPGRRVKVLDFGLATRPRVGGWSPEEADLPTALEDRTGEGVILGTPAYMSPEQARGTPVDKRTDIWAFGCILYEMLAGRRPFAGETPTDAIAATIERDPNWSELPATTPATIVALLRRCLEKNPVRRLRDIGEARVALEHALEASNRARPGGTRRHLAPGVGRAVAAVVLAGVVLGALITWLPRLTSGGRPAVPTRLTVALPPHHELNADAGAAPLAISPDGRVVVYGADDGGGRMQLYLRRLDAFDSRALTGTEGAQYPFFSPDGDSIGFFARGRLLRMSLGGGAPVPLCDVPAVGYGATWGSDGTIVFPSGDSGLMRVSAQGGPPDPLTSADPEFDRRPFHWPHFVAGSDVLLASVGSEKGAFPTQIAAFSFRTRQWRVLMAGIQPQYVPPGYLVFHADHIREGELQAVGFNPSDLTVRGTPVSVMDGLFRARSGGAVYFAISRSGTLVFAPGGYGRTLLRVDRNGHRTTLVDDRRGFRFPRLSPDGRFLAVTVDPRPSEIWIYDLERGSRTPLGAAGHSILAVWNPDGQRVVFTLNTDLYLKPADASSAPQRLLDREGPQYPHSWSRDGRFLFFYELGPPTTKRDVWGLELGGAARPLVATPANELHPAISPDARWLAYDSDESGRAEIYVRPFPDVATRRWTVSADGGHSPLWSPDGRELFYMNGQDLIAVTMGLDGPSLVPGAPSVLFSGPFDTTQDNNYDVSSDGHFIMIEPDPEELLHGLHVVLDWSSELESALRAQSGQP